MTFELSSGSRSAGRIRKRTLSLLAAGGVAETTPLARSRASLTPSATYGVPPQLEA